MTLVIPQDYAAVIHSLRWSGDPELMAVTYAVGIDTASPPTDPASLALDLGAVFGAVLDAVLSAQIEFINTEVKWQVTAPPDPPLVGSAAAAVTGQEVGDTLPQNCSFLVHKRSASGGRGGRGRMYFPGVLENACDNLGNLTSGEISEWNTALETWRTQVLAVDGVTFMVILHDSNGAHAADPPRPVTTLSMDPKIATQRRRLRR